MRIVEHTPLRHTCSPYSLKESSNPMTTRLRFALLLSASLLAACASVPPTPAGISSLSSAPDAATLIAFYGSDRRNRYVLLNDGPCEKKADGSYKRTAYATPVFTDDGRQREREIRVKANTPVTISYYSELSSTSCWVAISAVFAPATRYNILTAPVAGRPRSCDIQIEREDTKEPVPFMPASGRVGERGCLAPQQ
jgi:hypothetical protein